MLLFATSAAMLSSSTHGQNLVTNGSFESPTVQGLHNMYTGVDTVSLTGWVVDQAGTSVDHVNELWNDAEGFQSIDLNGTEAGSIYQDLATTSAQKYKIRFALAGNSHGFDDKRLEVLWDGAQIADLTFAQAGYNDSDMGWAYHEFIATAGDNSTRLTFHSLTGAMQGDEGFYSWYGPAIDDVSVSAIPEPGAAMMALVGFSLLVPTRRNISHTAK
jgi:choice-of-anchor C domain-containing protein